MKASAGRVLAMFLRIAGLLMLFGHAPPAASQPVQPSARKALVPLIQVGPGRAIKSLAAAAKIARRGTVIEVDAGDYRGDVAVWTADDLTLRAVGGRVRLSAEGFAAEGKGIWVVRAENVVVQGFDFSGATVPDHNGAGIRFESGSLTVRDCSFLHNETGILTGNDPQSRLRIEASEFGFNGYGDGQTHNLYVGRIAYFHISGSYLHHARLGHLLKSRAAQSQVLYNRLTDELGGTASYELEFPNGGEVRVMGNIIQQSEDTSNSIMVSFGAEQYAYPVNSLQLVHNTFVNSRSGGQFLRVYPGVGPVLAVNNVFFGNAQWPTDGWFDRKSNAAAGESDFSQPDNGDYRLSPGSILRARAAAESENPPWPTPTHEYVHPLRMRALKAPPTRPGALQTPGPTIPRHAGKGTPRESPLQGDSADILYPAMRISALLPTAGSSRAPCFMAATAQGAKTISSNRTTYAKSSPALDQT